MFNKYLADALSVDTRRALVTKNGAWAYRAGRERGQFRGCYGTMMEGKDTRRAPGLEWGRWVGDGAVLEEPSQRGEISHYWFLPGKGYHSIIKTCVKNHASWCQIKVGLTGKGYDANVLYLILGGNSTRLHDCPDYLIEYFRSMHLLYVNENLLWESFLCINI